VRSGGGCSGVWVQQGLRSGCSGVWGLGEVGLGAVGFGLWVQGGLGSGCSSQALGATGSGV